MEKITDDRITPNKKKLFKLFIPHSGHTQSDAIFDLIDNCIDADAKEIKLQIFSTDGGKIEKYRIIDNGSGMDKEQLIKSYQFANDSSHVKGSMGKYGIGGTTAAFSLGGCKKVYTKQKNGTLYVSYQDIDEDEFGIHIGNHLSDEERAEFFENCGDHGTIVEVSKLLQERQYGVAAFLRNFLVKEIGETYRYFLDTKKISIEVLDKNGKATNTVIHADDPMHWNENCILYKEERKYTVDGREFSLRFVKLDPNKVSEKVHQNDQGFYFVRNNRQIIGRVSSIKDLWSNHPTNNYQRVEFRFHEDLDKHVGLTATKNKISLSQSISDKIKTDVTSFKNGYKQANTTSDADVKEIQENLDQHTKRLAKNAAALGAPKSKTEAVDTKRSPAKNNSGAILPKNTDITRRPPQEPSRVVPNFEICSMNIKDIHVSYSIEDGQAKVFINSDSEFIKENYINAGSDVKRQLENYWSAVAITLYQEYDENEREFSICKEYADKVTQVIAKIHQLV